jgi:WD40 repeat protein
MADENELESSSYVDPDGFGSSKNSVLFENGKYIMVKETNEKSLKTIVGHNGIVYALVMTSTGKLASASADKTIKLWDLDTLECLKTITGHEDSVRSLISGKNDDQLISGSSDKFIKVWSIENSACLTTLSGHLSSIYALALAESGELCSGSYDNTIRIWDQESGECKRVIKDKDYCFWTLLISKDGSLISGSADSTIKSLYI